MTIIQEARKGFFKELGFTELDLGDGRTGIIIGDLVINFKSEGFEEDVLLIETGIGELKDNGMRFFYRVSNRADGRLISLAETGLVAFDYEAREVRRWPDGFFKTISGKDSK